jgi:DNA-binding CsgD family transcriptional regulator
MVQLALALHASGDSSRAMVVLRECLAVSEEHGELWARAIAYDVLALVEQAVGDLATATVYAREALRIKWLFRNAWGSIVCIEVLAWLTGAQGEAECAARLLGVVQANWHRFGQTLFGSPFFIAQHEQCERRVRALLGNETYQTTVAQGAMLGLNEVIFSLVGEQEAGRPASSGRMPLMPLTRREQEIAVLVAQGLSNRQIAERLSISSSTVGTHVGKIMTKLGLTSRTELMAWIATQLAVQNSDPQPAP